MAGCVPHPTLLGPGPVCTWGPLVLSREPQSTRSAPPPGLCTSCALCPDAAAESQRPEDPVTIPDGTVGARRLGLGASGLKPGNGCQPCCAGAPVWYWWAGPTPRGVRKGPPSPGPADSAPPPPCPFIPLPPPLPQPPLSVSQSRDLPFIWEDSTGVVSGFGCGAGSQLCGSPQGLRGSPGKRRAMRETSSEVQATRNSGSVCGSL